LYLIIKRSKDKINKNDVCNDPNILYKRWLIRNISKPDSYPVNYIIKEIRSLDGTDIHLQALKELVDKNIKYKNNQEVSICIYIYLIVIIFIKIIFINIIKLIIYFSY